MVMQLVHHHRIRRGIVAGTLAGSVVMAVGVPAAHAAVDCVVSAGVTQTATTVTGTNGNDTIACGGASRGKKIIGRAGNDTITGTAFHDTINGGRGNDTLTGGGRGDILTGGRGSDTMTGGAGRDTLSGGRGSDTVSGSGGNDVLNGGLGIDTLSGGGGHDVLKGPASDGRVDTLNGGQEATPAKDPDRTGTRSSAATLRRLPSVSIPPFVTLRAAREFLTCVFEGGPGWT
jgi:Ca2+-binding RTX toxin-like protein